MIAFLVNNRLVDFNKQDSDGFLPLNLLCVVSDFDLLTTVIRLLKKNGYIINFKKQDKWGYTPLHMACNKWNGPKLQIIELLLKNGVDPNALNNKGDTALHEMVELGGYEYIRILLDNKAKADIPNKEKLTPLTKMLYRPDLASYIDCLELLMKNNTGRNRPEEIDPMVLAYQKGFWIRLLGAYCRTEEDGIKREIDILKKRESFSNEKLLEHNPEYDVDKNPELSYSPATYVKAGIPGGLFGDGFGVVIQTERLIPAWCSGLNGDVKTDRGNDVNFKAQKLTFKYAEEHLSHNVMSIEIALMYYRLYEEYRSRDYSPKNRYETIVGKYPSVLPYNEGLFRYKKNDIKAIYLASNPKSAFYAVKLFNVLGRNVPYCTYDSVGKILRIDKEEVLDLSKKYNPDEQDKHEMLFAQEPYIPIAVSSEVLPAKFISNANASEKMENTTLGITKNKEGIGYLHGTSSSAMFKAPPAPKQTTFKQLPAAGSLQKKEYSASSTTAKK